MNNSAIIILAAVLLAWIILATIWCSIVSKKYQQYIDSSKSGEKFAMRRSFDNGVNPFKEKREPIIVEITDIRTNKIGEKYIQYRYIGDPPYLTFNNKIDIFTELFCKIF